MCANERHKTMQRLQSQFHRQIFAFPIKMFKQISTSNWYKRFCDKKCAKNSQTTKITTFNKYFRFKFNAFSAIPRAEPTMFTN